MPPWYPQFWNVPRRWRVGSWVILFILAAAASGQHGPVHDVAVWLALPFAIIPIADIVVAIRQAYVEWLYERNWY